MTDEPWTPAIAFGEQDVLVDGFPDYLREPLIEWLSEKQTHNYFGTETSFFLRFQAAMKRDFGFGQSKVAWHEEVIPFLRNMDDDTFTNLVSFALHTWRKETEVVDQLAVILTDGSSKWQVSKILGKPRLVERVPDGIQTVVNEVIAARSLASEKLKEAWADAYGINPRPSVAYQHAVIAVEIAALSVVKVNKPDPTLGDVITILESQKTKWRLPFRDSPKAPRIDVLTGMLRLLWRGQASRHGRPDYENAADEEARGAVMLASTLVSWFVSDFVVKETST
jgi:hypothetical protein